MTLVLTPRRLYNTIKSQTIDAPGLKGALCRKAVATKIDNLRKYGTYEHALYDRLVFKKVKKALGGNVKLVGSGSAPIAPEVLEFLKVVLVCDVTEGYGQTEGHATCNRCWPVDPDPQGTCGPPIPVNEIRLKDVPEMGALLVISVRADLVQATSAPTSPSRAASSASVGRTSSVRQLLRTWRRRLRHGRVAIGAGSVEVVLLTAPAGYYKDDAKSKELMDGETGWMRSGDIALVDDKARRSLSLRR